MDCTINIWGAVELFGGVGRSPQKRITLLLSWLFVYL